MLAHRRAIEIVFDFMFWPHKTRGWVGAGGGDSKKRPVCVNSCDCLRAISVAE
jgi:hypothetical protein